MLAIHPSLPEQFQLRNELLQRSLRPDPLPFPIENEFPIVLAPEGREFSYCAFEGEKLCSHVNLWPRRVLDKEGRSIFRVGLVGNVATDAGLRGQGHMRSLLMTIESEAVRQGLAALILWSDLDQFYHKLAYKSLGREFRFHYLASELHMSSTVKKTRHLAANVDARQLAALMDLRLPVPLTLERSAEEFRRLLEIPWLDLYTAHRDGELCAYALLGKGYDMVGIVHEWGARDPEAILDLLAFICEENEFAQTMLLCPASVPLDWKEAFQAPATLCEKVPMALVKILQEEHGRQMDDMFVWGLDSI